MPNLFNEQRRKLLAALVLTPGLMLPVVSGCAQWNVDPDSSPKDLPRPRMSPDTVVLEVATIYIDPNLNQLDSDLWRDVSEVHLDASLKRQLWQNGFRVARIGQEIPPAIRKQVDQFRENSRLSQIGKTGDGEVGHHRRQSRAGVPSQILTSSVISELNLITQEGDYVSGKKLNDAQCVLEIRTQPHGDGSVELVILPEIHYGQNRPQFAGRNGAFQLLVEREKEIIEKLHLQQLLTPGESLMLSCTPEPVGLGRHFFAWNPKLGHKVILIRLAQVQYDELFAPRESAEPLTNL